MSESVGATNQPGSISQTASAADGQEPGSSASTDSPPAHIAQNKNSFDDFLMEHDGKLTWENAKTLRGYWKTRKQFFTDTERADAWEKTAEIVEKYSDEMVKRWNGEIDTLLVYGGLFSAVLTAFNVQSYQLLTPPPATDPVIMALERISAQLTSFSVNPLSINATHSAFVYNDPVPLPAPRYAIWLNALWFASIIFSLSAASIGIMVKQWLSEYSSGLSGKSRQIARLRQLRLNGLRRWHVKEIVAVLPVLLQIASALFLVGLLVLLWQLNRMVATVATVLVGLLVVFSMFTIILPSITASCIYLSPPSRAVHELTLLLKKLQPTLSSWILLHYMGTTLPLHPLRRDEFKRNHPYMYTMWTLLGTNKVPLLLRWNQRELHMVAEESDGLDADSITTAYTTGMDTNYLHHASVCITELTLAAARQCFRAIQCANIPYWGELPMLSVHPCMWSGAIISLMDAASPNSSPAPPSTAQELEGTYWSMSPYNSHVSSALSHTRLVSIDLARSIRHCNQSELPSDTMNIAEKIYNGVMKVLANKTSDISLGNDVRQEVMSVCIQNVPPGWENAQTELRKTEKTLNVIQCILCFVPALGSPDYKPDDPEYQALRAQASSTLEPFSQLLSTHAAIKLYGDVSRVFYALRDHGEKAGLLSPLLIRAMSGYLDEYKKEQGELPWYLRDKEEWIRTLYRNLTPDDSKQNPNTAVVVSAFANVDDSETPLVHLASVAADTATHRAFTTITSVQTTNSARLKVSRPEALSLTSFHAPPTTTIQDSASVELTPCAPMSEDAPPPPADPGSARIDSGEVSETPAHADEDGVSETHAPVRSGGTSDANPQETELSSTEIPSLSRPAVQISGHADPSE